MSSDFPTAIRCTESKRYETELACRDGAVEIDMVINIGKALGGDWDYVERDVKAVCDEAHRHGAKVKVIFENDYLDKGGAGLDGDNFKRKLCQICERAGADWVKTSTGFGFVKQPDGQLQLPGCDGARFGTDAGGVLAQGSGESGRRRARPGRFDARARPRGQPMRGIRHRRDSG